MKLKNKCCICNNESTKDVLIGDHLYSICDEHLLLFDIAVYNAYMSFRADRMNNYNDIVCGENCEFCGVSCEKEDDLIILHIKDLDIMLCENCASYFNKLLEDTLNNISIITSILKENI